MIKTKKGYDIKWHSLSDGFFRFTEEDVSVFEESTKKKAIWGGNLTNHFKGWLKANFDRDKPLKTPRFLKTGNKHRLSNGMYFFTPKDVKVYKSEIHKTAFTDFIHPTKNFKKWLIAESKSKHKEKELRYTKTEGLATIVSPHRKEELERLMGKYGTIYTPLDIKEEVSTIVGEDHKKNILDDFFMAFSEFSKISTAFSDISLFPSFTFLLYGVSGTGKTTLTRAFAKKYGLPIIVIESARIISSLLGDTLRNLTEIFSNAITFCKNQCPLILFFDELDALGSERSSGSSEIGEMKRATISFMQSLDKLTYENHPIIVFGATNHESLLDKAIWRRFGFHLSFTYPNYHMRYKIITSFLAKIKILLSKNAEFRNKIDIDKDIEKQIEIEYNELKTIIKKNNIMSRRKEFPEEKKDGLWHSIKNLEDNILKITYGQTGSDIERAFKNEVFRSLRTGEISLKTIKSSLESVGTTYKKENLLI